jgi:hypothetical protein
MTDLIKYDAMCTAIAECHQIDEVKDLHNKALALELYAKQARNTDAERRACEIRLRAERRTGELLKELPRATPAQAGAKGNVAQGKDAPPAMRSASPSPYAKALSDTGISTQSASRYQALASVPPDQFEAALGQPSKPTTNAILRAANGATRMDERSLWIWGRLRDMERDGLLRSDAAEVFGGMTDTMQADVLRVLPAALEWLQQLHEVTQCESP